MAKDSHKKKSQSETPPSRSRSRSTQPERSGGSDRRSPGGGVKSLSSSSRSPYTPSRLSHVTNSRDISEVDAQTEALSNLSFEAERPRTAAPLTFDSIAAWERQGGRLEALDDGTLEMLLSQYIGTKDSRPTRRKYQPPKVVPPPAPVLEDEEGEESEEGGVYLGDSSQSWSRQKDQGSGRVR